MTDQRYMARALQLARKGLFTTTPNPRVGCVVVRDGEIVGEGWHQFAGQDHAEVAALKAAGDKAEGATAYVTLEPCNHTGRTPPCVKALIEANIAKVVIASKDTHQKASGGIAALREAGIEVADGVLEAQARQLNAGFFKRMEQGLPWVRLKMAASLDGRTAMASGESQWITGAEARVDVQRLRAQSCAIISGIGTVTADDPQLNVRLSGEARQPLKVIVDSQLRCSPKAKVLQQGPVLIATVADGDASHLEAAGAEILRLRPGWGGVSLEALLKELAARDINEVLVEAGAQLAGAFVKQGLVDQFHLYYAPTLLGSRARPLFELPIDIMSDQHRLSIDDVRQLGNDLRIDAHLAPA